MKHIVFALATMSVLVLPSHGSEETLSAQELAHHIGVSSWVSKMRLQGADFVLQVLHVVNGKVVGNLIGSPAFSTNREFTRVAILAGQTPTGTQLSIQVPSAPAVKRQMTHHLPLEATVPLPPTIAEGDYVLGGDLRVEAINQERPVPTIEDVREGILLRVTRRPQ